MNDINWTQIGGIITSIILGAYSAWATWSNQRKSKLNAVLGQNIETAREVFKAQPNGAALDAAFTTEIKAQQVDAGVKSAAAKVADEQVNTVEAKESAERVSNP